MQSNTTIAGAGPRHRAPSPTSGLPVPGADALAHSERLREALRSEIRRSGGWIPFPSFMRMALYEPGLGYYVAGARKFGHQGDFYTAPEMSALFGYALANQFADVLKATDGNVLELGAGTGRLAADILHGLHDVGALPATYAILETSPDLRERQQQTLGRLSTELAARVRWLDTLPDAWTGVIFGNEVLDALPVELLARRGGIHYRRGVTIDGDDGFAWHDAVLSAGPHAESIQSLYPAGDYQSEINPEAEALTRTLAHVLQRGLLLWIDYGFPAAEYYHPQRNAGTLMCHYRQHAHADPLWLPGMQDITAHVDFSAIAHAGVDAGLDLAGYSGQASFLIGCGIVDLLQLSGAPGSAGFLRESNAVQRMLSPAEMGELFKVIAFTRAVDQPLRGFSSGDRSHRL